MNSPHERAEAMARDLYFGNGEMWCEFLREEWFVEKVADIMVTFSRQEQDRVLEELEDLLPPHRNYAPIRHLIVTMRAALREEPK